MNTLTQNTFFESPSFAVNTQLESTGIRELTQDEIELVNGAMAFPPHTLNKGEDEWVKNREMEEFQKGLQELQKKETEKCCCACCECGCGI